MQHLQKKESVLFFPPTSIWEAFSPRAIRYCVGCKSYFCKYIKHDFVSLCASKNLSYSCSLFLNHVPALI